MDPLNMGAQLLLTLARLLMADVVHTASPLAKFTARLPI
jgi:hypothetical protein